MCIYIYIYIYITPIAAIVRMLAAARPHDALLRVGISAIICYTMVYHTRLYYTVLYCTVLCLTIPY